MKKLTLILLVVLALTMSACTRAASTAPLATPSPDANFPQPVSTSNMNAIEMAGTQTAIATSGLPMPTAAVNAEAASATATGADANSTQVVVINPTFTPLAGSNPTQLVSTPLPTITPQAQAENTAAAKTSVPSSNPGTYTLHDGEFPYCLARRFNVDPIQLLTLNGLSANQSYYAPGKIITIPQSGAGFPGPRSLKAHPTSYTVRSGDTIYSIACGFGDVDPMSIANSNNLSGSYSLTVGSTIQIP